MRKLIAVACLLLPGVVHAQAISQLPAASSAGSTDLIPTTQGFTGTGTGTTRSITPAMIIGTMAAADVARALGYTPYSTANPAGYVTPSGAAAAAPVQSVFGRSGSVALLSSDVSTALGYTPYSAANIPNAGLIGGNGTVLSGVSVGSGLGLTSGALTAAVPSVFGRTGAIALLSADVTGALGFTPYSSANPSAFVPVGTTAGTARDAAAAIAAESAAQTTANTGVTNAAAAQTTANLAIPSSTLGQANGPAALNSTAKVLTVSLVNRATIAPTTTTVGTSPTTVFPAGTYLSIRIALTATGSLACTGDGTTPALGGTGTASFGQDIHWPVQAGGAMPTSVVSCIAGASSTVTTEAH